MKNSTKLKKATKNAMKKEVLYIRVSTRGARSSEGSRLGMDPHEPGRIDSFAHQIKAVLRNPVYMGLEGKSDIRKA